MLESPEVLAFGIFVVGVVVVWILLSVMKSLFFDKEGMKLWGIWLIVVAIVALCMLAALPTSW